MNAELIRAIDGLDIRMGDTVVGQCALSALGPDP